MSTSVKAQRFIDANLKSPLEYQSSDGDTVTFRLKDGSLFALSADEARAVDQAGHLPRWQHLWGFYGDAPLPPPTASRLVGCEA